MRTRADELISNIRTLGDRPVTGAEIGVWRGDTSLKLLSSCPSLHLILVDRWRPPEPGDSHYTSGSVFVGKSREEFDRAHDSVTRKIEKYGFRDRVTVMRSDSLDAASRIPDRSLDFVFIDADHSYEGCRADLDVWPSKVAPGGFVSGHDYGNAKFPGVRQAWDGRYPVLVAGEDHTVFTDVAFIPDIDVATVYFEYPGKTVYRRLLDVFRFSLERTLPEARLMVLSAVPPDREKDPGRQKWASNLLKVELWREAVRRHMREKGDRPLILMDCDMIVRRDITTQFRDEFDISFTQRADPKTCEPINTGIMCIRPSSRVIEFFDRLVQVTTGMWLDPEFHERYWQKYRGIMQAGIGYMIERDLIDLEYRMYPCSIWNACDREYPGIGTETKVVHLKENIRKRLGKSPVEPKYAKAMSIWNEWSSRLFDARGRHGTRK